MTAAAARPDDDIAALAKGGRTNFFGFVIRLVARIPFLFIAGHFYGPELLGRFAYAVIVVELAAQLSTMGLKRGLAQQLSTTDKPHAHVVADGMLAAFIASAVASAILMAFPQAMFPHNDIKGAEWLLPLVIFGISGADVALAALAYKLDVRSTVHVRAIVEPWVISIAAGALYLTHYKRDGLIIAYVASVVAGLLAALWRLFRSYGVARGWRPHPETLMAVARRNIPLAAADAIEWFSRRLDIAILGLFVAPQFVGIYYVAQQVASMPQKLKTSFDPILAPVITQKLAEGDKGAVARQVRQVGFWIIAAQAGIALALGIPGEALMGLFGESGAFVGGTAALAFLLAAEVVAATAAVSEAALVYVARHRNLLISALMIATQAALTVGIILAMRSLPLGPAELQAYQAAGAALALALALGMASILKSRLLARILSAPVQGWRWSLIWAGAAASVVGFLATLLPEWLELSLGAPLILVTFGMMVWYRGFTAEDRTLFRMQSGEEPALPVSEPATP
ncbi:MAG TPA: oligosaccharide flippase family protein [Allosphingosinicella sp.]|jgi:O-antigen/teichoic acid export membrane protein|nr:oligosaccharide flippase family protein [Allosphingosinicella sp.]